VTVAELVENAVREHLAKLTSRKGSHLTQRLRYANALIAEVLAVGSPIAIAGTGPANIHQKEPRQLRRNEISQKAAAAFDQVYDLAQAETLAEQNQARGVMYEVLARLAEVNGALLKDASDEEVLEDLQELREAQLKFEETTSKLEAEAAEAAGKK
jgi:hypothetical protein